MAIAPTGAIYKALSFDNTSSRNYGVYITGEAVYNAPVRDVEMITIPGRNGSFALDNGRFENITVTYPAGIFADTEADFVQAISDFRNFLCSKKGYCRLTDEYNPNEYRMAIYKAGLEVEPALLRAGEFNITFECKPQRWLTSGETEVTIASSGDTITNPTLFKASPLLKVVGYGTIEFNGYDIELLNEEMGNVILASSGSFAPPAGAASYEHRIQFNDSVLNNGDSFNMSIQLGWRPYLDGWVFDYPFTGQTVTDSNSGSSTSWNAGQSLPTKPYNQPGGSWQSGYTYTTEIEPISFQKGTSKTWTNTATVASTQIATKVGGVVTTENITIDLIASVAYDGTNPYIVINLSEALSDPNVPLRPQAILIWRSSYSEITGYSTVSQLGNPTFIDCDFGEAYLIKNGEPVSLNSYIDLGSDLPILEPGSNTISFDNTITSLKIVPGWWKV